MPGSKRCCYQECNARNIDHQQNKDSLPRVTENTCSIGVTNKFRGRRHPRFHRHARHSGALAKPEHIIAERRNACTKTGDAHSRRCGPSRVCNANRCAALVAAMNEEATIYYPSLLLPLNAKDALGALACVHPRISTSKTARRMNIAHGETSTRSTGLQIGVPHGADNASMHRCKHAYICDFAHQNERPIGSHFFYGRDGQPR